MGGRLPIEEKPLKKTRFDENMQKYCITFLERDLHYNFFHSQEIVLKFLTVF